MTENDAERFSTQRAQSTAERRGEQAGKFKARKRTKNEPLILAINFAHSIVSWGFDVDTPPVHGTRRRKNRARSLKSIGFVKLNWPSASKLFVTHSTQFDADPVRLLAART